METIFHAELDAYPLNFDGFGRTKDAAIAALQSAWREHSEQVKAPGPDAWTLDFHELKLAGNGASLYEFEGISVRERILGQGYREFDEWGLRVESDSLAVSAIYYVRMAAKNFEFEGYGATPEDALDALKSSWSMHAGQGRGWGLAIPNFKDFTRNVDLVVRECILGQGYCKGKPIAIRK